MITIFQSIDNYFHSLQIKQKGASKGLIITAIALGALAISRSPTLKARGKNLLQKVKNYYPLDGFDTFIFGGTLWILSGVFHTDNPSSNNPDPEKPLTQSDLSSKLTFTVLEGEKTQYIKEKVPELSSILYSGLLAKYFYQQTGLNTDFINQGLALFLEKLKEIRTELISEESSEILNHLDYLLEYAEKQPDLETLKDLGTQHSLSKMGHGLENGWNRCFLNASLQLAFLIEPLRSTLCFHERQKNIFKETAGKYFAAIFYQQAFDINRSLRLAHALLDEKGGEGCLLSGFIRGEKNEQHDTQEALISFFDISPSKFSDNNSKPIWPIKDSTDPLHQKCGVGQVRTYLVSEEARETFALNSSEYKCSVEFEPLLQVTVEHEIKDTAQPSTFLEALQYTLNEGNLNDGERINIDQESHIPRQQILSTKTRLVNAPECLIIQFKRFGFDPTAQKSSKLNRKIKMEQEFKITGEAFFESPGKEANYNVAGFIHHSGSSSTSSGHYVTYIKLLEKGQWLKLNDGNVSQIDEKEAIERLSECYIVCLVKKIDKDHLSESSDKDHLSESSEDSLL